MPFKDSDVAHDPGVMQAFVAFVLDIVKLVPDRTRVVENKPEVVQNKTPVVEDKPSVVQDNPSVARNNDARVGHKLASERTNRPADGYISSREPFESSWMGFNAMPRELGRIRWVVTAVATVRS